MSKVKFYTVWIGRKPGVYSSWSECEQQIKGYKGAKFKSFERRSEALQALEMAPEAFLHPKREKATFGFLNPEKVLDGARPIPDSIAVDAACSGNPGRMEYRGVDVKTGYQIFHYGPLEEGTNNIGEFLAIVHAVASFHKTNPQLPVYSDSQTAISWVKNKKAKTKLQPNGKNKPVFDLIRRAEHWLANNTYSNPILKWETQKWGEIPADFGRK